ncbi:hypothetical protein [Lucifera butyrica]|nr:hypothetical protein [Lucifera butyrica]
MDDLTGVLAYYKTSREERDYSFIASAQHQDMNGVCIYLAKSGDALARDHYFKLRRTARDCTYCGVCVPRYPFHVDILKRMREANEFFGR